MVESQIPAFSVSNIQNEIAKRSIYDEFKPQDKLRTTRSILSNPSSISAGMGG